ncbi:MAG: hypothetical protein KC621_16895 [Myxococcales bacterium]|nr:hypothetical protein [Myxococcales bacterium]
MGGLLAGLVLGNLATASTHVEMNATTSDQLEGVTTEWSTDGCRLWLVVRNDALEPIEVDWGRSAIATAGQESASLIPGSSTKLASTLGIPVSVVPPGSYLDEVVLRKDRLSSCTVHRSGVYDVSLRVGATGLTQHLVVDTPEPVPATDADREAILADIQSYPHLDLRVGEVCFVGPSGERCQPSTGIHRPTALAAPVERMRVLGCADAERIDTTLLAWKRWRKTGNWLLPWFHTTPAAPVAWFIGGQVAGKAERTHDACMSTGAVD